MNKESIKKVDRFYILQAAKVLGVSPQTLRRWDTRGILKAYRDEANGYRFYTREQLQEFILADKKIRYRYRERKNAQTKPKNT